MCVGTGHDRSGNAKPVWNRQTETALFSDPTVADWCRARHISWLIHCSTVPASLAFLPSGSRVKLLTTSLRIDYKVDRNHRTHWLAPQCWLLNPGLLLPLTESQKEGSWIPLSRVLALNMGPERQIATELVQYRPRFSGVWPTVTGQVSFRKHGPRPIIHSIGPIIRYRDIQAEESWALAHNQTWHVKLA